jgi:hypothetical protein
MRLLAIYEPDLPPNVIDFTVYRLERCIEAHLTDNSPHGKAYESALVLYLQRKLAIEWDSGQPFAIVIDADSARELQDHGATNQAEDYQRLYDQQRDEMTGIDEKDENENPNDSE